MTLAELKADKRWFLWNYSPGKSGKVTKVPMSAMGGKTGTSEDYRSTWVDYNEALLAKDKYKASGIGFVIPKGMYFFDIDGRALDDSFVILMLERFGSYAEKSPSGNGIHVLGNCNDEALPFVYDEKKKRYTVAQEFYQKIHITISNYTSVTQLIDMQPLQVMQSMTLILQMERRLLLQLLIRI